MEMQYRQSETIWNMYQKRKNTVIALAESGRKSDEIAKIAGWEGFGRSLEAALL
jgi:predicted GNAT family acetyltransferase